MLLSRGARGEVHSGVDGRQDYRLGVGRIRTRKFQVTHCLPYSTTNECYLEHMVYLCRLCAHEAVSRSRLLCLYEIDQRGELPIQQVISRASISA